jgi:hypothetical protein
VTPPAEAGGSGSGALEGPVSSTPWSPDFVAQTLELLIVHRVGEEIHVLRPVHADALHVGWSPGRSPDELLSGVLGRYGLVPRVLHSTSWRQAGDRVVLTYLSVVDPSSPPSPHLIDEPVVRADLARSDPTAAPADISTTQVLEHALRHLAWLTADDATIGGILADWRPILESYLPEPFRQLED